MVILREIRGCKDKMFGSLDLEILCLGVASTECHPSSSIKKEV